jgi:hypothetical protein
MKDQMLQLIEKRIEKAKREHYIDNWLDRNEYISVTAELIALKYEIEMMEI